MTSSQEDLSLAWDRFRLFTISYRDVLIGSTLTFTVALVLRLLIHYNGGYSFLGVDENTYLRYARGFFQGTYLGKAFLPGWPYVLSWAMRISTDIGFLRVFVVLVDCINAVLVYLLARHLFNHRTGVLAGLIFAFYPEQVFFAHYLQAEVFLEFIILAATYFAFASATTLTRGKKLMLAFLVLGLGALYKHFIGITLLALLPGVLLAIKSKTLSRSYATVLLLLFLFPLLAYSVKLKLTGRDPFMFINSPIKSVGEWSRNTATGLDYAKRKDLLKNHLESLKQMGPGRFYRIFRRNIFNLWTPNSHHITRLLYYRYGTIANPWPWAYGSAIYFTVVMILGLTGLCLSEKSLFKTYSIVSLVTLTSMGITWFLVSRYRLPFMFTLIIYAAHVLSNFGFYRREITGPKIMPRLVLIALLVFLAFVYVERWPHLGSWI